MKKFKYKKERVPHLMEAHYNTLSVDELNELGEKGWELVVIVGGECIFKREILEDE